MRAAHRPVRVPGDGWQAGAVTAQAASLDVRRLGDVPWLVVRGPREACFRALGEHARHRVRDALAVLAAPNGPGYLGPAQLRASRHFEAVAAASRTRTPDAWAELAALAEGAAVPLDDLLVVNLRGDLGAADGTGCSDLAWSDGTRGVLAHNEDGLPGLAPLCTLLTLDVAGAAAVTTWWYPGFLPANAFWVNGSGLCVGTDHLVVPVPDDGPGRHFAARTAQASRTLDGLLVALADGPAAGGFAYCVGAVAGRDGDPAPRAALVERAAGRSWCSTDGRDGTTTDGTVHRHTNHPRHLPPGTCPASADSLERAAVLDALTAADGAGPDVVRCLDVLTAQRPHGVAGRDVDGTPNTTLATFVVDLATGRTTVRPLGGAAVEVAFDDLVAPA